MTTTPAYLIKRNKALQVLQTVEEGTTIVAACRKVGIPRSTFYDLIGRHPDILGQFQDALEGNSRDQLLMILINRTRLLQELMDKAFADTTSTRELLAIYKTTESMLDKLVKTLGIENASSGDASEVLSGPVLVPAESRFSAFQVIPPKKDSAWE